MVNILFVRYVYRMDGLMNNRTSDEVLLFAYRKYNEQKERADQLEEKLNTLDNIHINLVRNFNLHLSICKSNNEVTAWQGSLINDPR